LYAAVYLKPKQLIIKDCARHFVLKLYTHEASRGLFATAELLVYFSYNYSPPASCCRSVVNRLELLNFYSMYTILEACSLSVPLTADFLVKTLVIIINNNNNRFV